ncbi:heme-binding protein [Psychrobacter sp. TAE2020]|uniref:SOUL family heme-binding protein n=1 Tax=Psychrobacter sp. TAE2020 TaxID=2846762 RepID=UPI001C0F7C02|nr:heme-binding protein [Psychrobacter sp. TAE2020]MBU5617898.1 heme-binding protein [Psychrobacter sp. TAE2020]
MKATTCLLLGSLLILPGEAMATEESNYAIFNKTEDFELRRYDPQIIAQTWVSGDQKQAGNKGFRILADYIFGNNTAPSGESSKISMTTPVKMQPQSSSNNSSNNRNSDKSGSEKIAMTAPVSMQKAQQQNDGKWRVRFVMPNKYTMQTLPKPNNPAVSIIEVPAKTYGVIKFSGLTGSKKVAAKTAELEAWMQNLNIVGTAEMARYNPPWTLPFMRRNEIMIEYQAK